MKQGHKRRTADSEDLGSHHAHGHSARGLRKHGQHPHDSSHGHGRRTDITHHHHGGKRHHAGWHGPGGGDQALAASIASDAGQLFAAQSQPIAAVRSRPGPPTFPDTEDCPKRGGAGDCARDCRACPNGAR